MKDLLWRSDKVGRFLERLEAVQEGKKSEQALCQSKERVLIKAASERHPPRNNSSVPRWAFQVKVGVQSVLRFRWAWSKTKFALVQRLGSFQDASYSNYRDCTLRR